MSPIDQLSIDLKVQFPNAAVETRKADNPNGFHFLNMQADGVEVGIEWKADQGFGLSSFKSGSSDLDGLFESPNEWYSTEEATFHRVVSLVLDRQSTRPRAARISAIRLERGISQEELSKQLCVKQATYSKLERRDDMKLSSLRKAIEAMGGRLSIQAVFSDARNVREITF